MHDLYSYFIHCIFCTKTIAEKFTTIIDNKKLYENSGLDSGVMLRLFKFTR